jgi:formyl-CoA transferase
VNSVPEALEDPQTVAREAVVEHEHPTLGTVRTLRTALRVSEGERPPARGPFRGEHTEKVLAGLCGYSAERIRELADAGVFGEVEVTA